MALKKNFKVKGGLEVADSAQIDGQLTAAGLKYPTADGSLNDVLKTDGQGNLTFGRVKISELDDVVFTALKQSGLSQYNAALQKWVNSTAISASREEDDLQIDIDAGQF